MSNEITKEELSKAIDATKDTVQEKDIGDKIELVISNEKKDYVIINSSASDKGNQLNAMAIAPIVNGKPDYNNVAVVYAGTNMPGEEGKTGFGSAGSAFFGGLSGEYNLAVDFLNETQKKVALKHGTITDVAGFSQSGGYMMKMATEYGPIYGFKTTSYDDWGRSQFDNLSKKERAWLLEHPEMLSRFQNDSWAAWSSRDSIYGIVVPIVGIGFGAHNTLANYFDGDVLNLDRLAKDGIFTPTMTTKQLEVAARAWVKNNRDSNPFTDEASEIAKRMKEYEKIRETFISDSYGTAIRSLYSLKSRLQSSSRQLTKNEQIYLDDSEALITLQMVRSEFELMTESVVKVYQDGVIESENLWTTTSSTAQSQGSLLTSGEVTDALSSGGFTEAVIVTSPSEMYQEKVDKVNGMKEKFNDLTVKI